MNFCTNCRAERGDGRFCTHCGRRRRRQRPPWATPPSGRPWAAPPSPPPGPPPGPPRSGPASAPANGPPSAPASPRSSRRRRTPASTATGAATRSTPTRSTPPPRPPAAPTTHRDDRARSLPALAAAWWPSLVVLVVVVGVWLLTRDDGSGDHGHLPAAQRRPLGEPARRDRPARRGGPDLPAGPGRRPDRPRADSDRHRAGAAPPGRTSAATR